MQLGRNFVGKFVSGETFIFFFFVKHIENVGDKFSYAFCNNNQTLTLAVGNVKLSFFRTNKSHWRVRVHISVREKEMLFSSTHGFIVLCHK